MKPIIGAMLAFLPLLAYAFAQKGQGGALAGAGAPFWPNYEPAADLPPLALPEPSFLETIGLSLMAATRGERNNNPGNIRLSSAPWQGKVGGSDTAFETFADAKAGIRALAVNLRTYQNRHGLDTIRAIITRYAPASENNTAAYVRAVANAVGTGPDDQIDLSSDGTLTALVAAIITHENGRNVYTWSDIAAAVSAA